MKVKAMVVLKLPTRQQHEFGPFEFELDSDDLDWYALRNREDVKNDLVWSIEGEIDVQVHIDGDDVDEMWELVQERQAEEFD